jgi:tetratricopeptide (TPR) repeat protein
MRIVAALALCLVACGTQASQSDERPNQPAVQMKDPSDQARKLALAAPPGDGADDRALRGLADAARKNPLKEEAWIALGRGWIKKARSSADPGFYLNASACADVALDLKKDEKLALDLKGLVLLNDHKFEEARALSADILKKHPDDPMAYGTLSDALSELGRDEEAAKAAQEMVDLKPNLPSYSRASYMQWLRGDEKGALESVRLAIDSGDTRDKEPRAWVLVQAAMIFWHRGDVDGAAAGFEQALAFYPEYPPALVGKGRTLLGKGDPKAAADVFGRAYRQSPLVETAWLLGDARTLAGDTAGAAEAYAAVEKEGKKSDPRTLSAFYSARNEKPVLALTLAEEEYKVRKDVYTEDTLAWALYRNGRIGEAKDAILRARRLRTNDARMVFHEGAIRIAAGEKVAGQSLVRRALALQPRFDAAGALEAAELTRN